MKHAAHVGHPEADRGRDDGRRSPAASRSARLDRIAARSTCSSSSRRWSTRARRILHITTDSPPQLRASTATWCKLQDRAAHADRHQAALLLGAHRRAEGAFEEDNELDLSFGIKGLARFRANVFMQQGAVAGAFRLIPFKIRSFDELGLPPIVARAVPSKPRGLVLVTGPTGSGKSTTLAAMIDKINIERPRATSSRSRTRSSSCTSTRTAWSTSARSAPTRSRSRTRSSTILRQDPDVVLVGEMRDLETIEAALTIAETGHLVLRHAAHQLRRPDHQPHHRRVPAAPAGADPRAALVRARGRALAAADPEARAAGARWRCEIMVPNAGHPEPDPRGQDPPDLLADAGRPGQVRHADDEPVAARAVPARSSSRSRTRSSTAPIPTSCSRSSIAAAAAPGGARRPQAGEPRGATAMATASRLGRHAPARARSRRA